MMHERRLLKQGAKPRRAEGVREPVAAGTAAQEMSIDAYADNARLAVAGAPG